MRCNYFLLTVLFFLLVGCTGESAKRKHLVQSGTLETIAIDVNKVITPSIDEIFSEIEIIPLSTPPESFFGQLGLITTYKGLLFFRDMSRRGSQVYCFDNLGKFQWKAGVIGKGPGEITGVTDAWINPYRDQLEIYDRDRQPGSVTSNKLVLILIPTGTG